MTASTSRSGTAWDPRRSRDRRRSDRRSSAAGRRRIAPGYTLTIRRGSRVERRRLDSLEAAIEALRYEADSVRAEGGLPKLSAFRTYEPEQRVNARIEVSTGRMLGRREAGVDVMGDGSLVPYLGGIFKQRLEPAGGETAFDAVREALHG